MIIKLKYDSVVSDLRFPWVRSAAALECYATAIEIDKVMYGLTAAQLLYDAENITYNGRPAKIVFHMVDYDLMLLEIDYSGAPTAVAALGADTLLYNSLVKLTAVEFRCIHLFKTKYLCLLAEPETYDEMVFATGAPIFNDKNQVVGVMQAMYENKLAVNFCIGNFIQHFKDKAHKVYSLPFAYAKVMGTTVVGDVALLKINDAPVENGRLRYRGAIDVSPNMYVMLINNKDVELTLAQCTRHEKVFKSGIFEFGKPFTKRVKCVHREHCYFREPMHMQAYLRLKDVVLKPVSVLDLIVNHDLDLEIKHVAEPHICWYVTNKADGQPLIVKRVNGKKPLKIKDMYSLVNSNSVCVFEFHNSKKPLVINVMAFDNFR